MVNNIAKINKRLDYTWVENKYFAELKDGKVVYEIGNEYRAINFDSGLVYHRLVGKPSFVRSANKETLFSFPLRTVIIAKVEECEDDETFLAMVAQTAIKNIDSMELRRANVLSDEGITIKEDYTAIYVDYTVTEGIGNVSKVVPMVGEQRTILMIHNKALTIGSQVITIE